MKEFMSDVFKFVTWLNIVMFVICCITYELTKDMKYFYLLVKLGLLANSFYIAHKLTKK